MISFGSLLQAAHSAARGKRFKPGVARFVFDLERQLLLLHEELASQTYRPGPYRTFTIYEGKTRQISAAPFRDRVVHHALDRRAGADLRAVVRLRQLRLPQGERHPRRRGPLPAVCQPLSLRSQKRSRKGQTLRLMAIRRARLELVALSASCRERMVNGWSAASGKRKNCLICPQESLGSVT